MRKSSRIAALILIVLFVCIALVWTSLLFEDRRGVLSVSFLDVGQGDAIFIAAPSGRQLLIDGGKGSAVLRELSRVMPWYDRTIDVVIGTHPDADHIGGLVEVLHRFHVPLVVKSSVRDDGTDFNAFEQAIRDEHASNLEAQRGDVIDLGAGARLEILFPDRDVPHIATNAGCVVSRLVFGDTAFMLPCDAPDKIENFIARLGTTTLKSNVLKVAHHGSKTSTAPLFLGFVDPEYAIFSRGCDNSYGHPAPEVVARVKNFGIQTLDTCEAGTITFVSDGQTVVKK